MIPRSIQAQLPLLHLGFLDAEDVGVRLLYKIQKALTQAGAQAVYIP